MKAISRPPTTMGDKSFDSCRFDFRLDSKNGLTPSKRKKSERRATCYNTLFKCKVCGNLYNTRAELLSHKVIHNRFKCKSCNSKFESRPELDEHLKTVHTITPNTKVTEFKCPICQEVFTSRVWLREHQSTAHGLNRVRGMVGNSNKLGSQSVSELLKQAPSQMPVINAQASISVSSSQTQIPGYVCINVPIVIAASGNSETAAVNSVVNSMLPQNMLSAAGVGAQVAQVMGDQPVQMKAEKTDESPNSTSTSRRDGNLEPGEIFRPVYSGYYSTPPQPSLQSSQPPLQTQVTSAMIPVNAAFQPSMISAGASVQQQGEEVSKTDDASAFQKAYFTGLDFSSSSSRQQSAPLLYSLQSPASTMVQPPICGQLGEVTESRSAKAKNKSKAVKRELKMHIIDPHQEFGFKKFHCSLCNFQTGSEAGLNQHVAKKHSELESVKGRWISDLLKERPSPPKPQKGLTQIMDKLWQNKMKSKFSTNYEAKKPSEAIASELFTNVHMASEAGVIVVRPISPEERRVGSLSSCPEDDLGVLDLSCKKKPCLKSEESSENTHSKLSFPSEEKPLDLSKDTNTSQPNTITQDYCSQVFYTCPVCKQLFDSADEMWQHSLTHQQQFNCPDCDFQTDQQSLLQEHALDTHGKVITLPGAAQQTPPTRRKRKREPIEIVPLSGVDLARSQLVDSDSRGSTPEVADSPSSDGNKPYRCPREGCQRAFRSIERLKRHVAGTHDDERPLVCRFGCGRAFKEPKHLRVHEMRHTDEKPLKCELCDYACRQRNSMNWHMKTRHGLEKYRIPGQRAIYYAKPGHAIPEVMPSPGSSLSMGSENESDATSQTGRSDSEVGQIAELQEQTEEETMPVTLVTPTDVEMSESSSQKDDSDSREIAEDEPTTTTTKSELLENDDSNSLKSEEMDKNDDTKNMEDAENSDTSPTNQHHMVTRRKSATIVRQSFISELGENGEEAAFQDILKHFQCEQCQQEFESEVVLWEHHITAHGNESILAGGKTAFVCHHCGKSFNSKPDLEDHIFVKHGDWLTEDLANSGKTCPVCLQLFESEEQLRLHKEVEHIEEYICFQCGANFDNRAELDVHVSTVHEEPELPFLCTVCGKSFATKAGLSHHKVTHADEPGVKYECPYEGCTWTGQSRTVQKTHIKKSHLKIKPQHPCPYPGCNRSFETLSAMHYHKVLHRSVRPLVCMHPGCGKAFREAKHLKVHRMQHTEEKPIKCHLCDYGCRQRNSMNWHMKSKHGLVKSTTTEGRTCYVPI